jgi:L-lactate dehydrogenase complex protein LldG
MTTDREAMLTRIRQSLKTTLLPGAQAVIPPRPAAHIPGAAAVLESFVREATAAGAEAHQPPTITEAASLVIHIIKEAGGSQLLSWADEELPLPGLGPLLAEAGIQQIQHANRAQLNQAVVGLTGALAGVADTGSLALLSGPGRPRSASLLPLVHIALLPIGRIVPTLAAFFATHSAQSLTDQHSNLVFITGPSRTADIEMVITRGVHGPKRLEIVLVPVS